MSLRSDAADRDRLGRRRQRRHRRNARRDQRFRAGPTLIGAGAFTHAAGQLRYDLIDAAGAANDFTILAMDANGDGVADSQITLRGW